MLNKTSFETNTAEFHHQFWNYLRKPNTATMNQLPTEARIPIKGATRMPDKSVDILENYRRQFSPLRQLATVIPLRDSHFTYFYHTSVLKSEWNEEGGRLVDTNTGLVDTTRQKITAHHLSSLIRVSNELKSDSTFPFEEQLLLTFGKEFGKEETSVFIHGDGQKVPYGLLHRDKGAEIGYTTSALTYDALLKLYASVAVEYRTQGTWIMSDTTMLQLRELTDKNGYPIWTDDTLLGRPVMIVNSMDKAEFPIAFGDFSYLWIFDYKKPSVKVLEELYIMQDQTGYLAYEEVETLLTKRDAIKLLQVKG